jgi:hypothetical protein
MKLLRFFDYIKEEGEFRKDSSIYSKPKEDLMIFLRNYELDHLKNNGIEISDLISSIRDVNNIEKLKNLLDELNQKNFISFTYKIENDKIYFPDIENVNSKRLLWENKS